MRLWTPRGGWYRDRHQRRRSESNRRIEVLQTSALPLGYGAGGNVTSRFTASSARVGARNRRALPRRPLERRPKRHAGHDDVGHHHRKRVDQDPVGHPHEGGHTLHPTQGHLLAAEVRAHEQSGREPSYPVNRHSSAATSFAPHCCCVSSWIGSRGCFRTPLFNSFRFLRRGRPSHHADPARRTAYPRRAPYTREFGDSTSQSPQNAMPLRTAIAQWLPANPLPKRYPRANSPTSPWMARVGPRRSDSPTSPPSRTGSAAYHAPP